MATRQHIDNFEVYAIFVTMATILPINIPYVEDYRHTKFELCLGLMKKVIAIYRLLLLWQHVKSTIIFCSCPVSIVLMHQVYAI